MMKQNELNRRWLRWAIVGAALLLTGAPQEAVGQRSQRPARGGTHATTQPRAGLRPAFSLRVSTATAALPLITLSARKASLQEVAAELQRQLKAQVVVSPALSRQPLSLSFRDLSLETALRLLAPQVYVDYEIGVEAAAQPRPMNIYLHAQDEAAPSIFGTVKTSSETFLMEGDTDEVGTAPDSGASSEGDQPLEVSFKKDLLSVRARKQPLAVVLYTVANKVGIPFSLRSDSRALVDADFSDVTLENGIRKLSTSARLYVRTDLQKSQTRPLRLVFESK